jgi:hypothetical protein
MSHLLFEKSFCSACYLAVAGPAVAVIMAYGITRRLVSRHHVRWALVVILLGVQLLGINWGAENRPLIGSKMDSLARAIEAAWTRSRVMVIGAGYGRRQPGLLSYELDPHIAVAVLTSSYIHESLLPKVQGYEAMWISLASDRATQRVEPHLLSCLQQSRRYREQWRNGLANQLRRVNKH